MSISESPPLPPQAKLPGLKEEAQQALQSAAAELERLEIQQAAELVALEQEIPRADLESTRKTSDFFKELEGDMTYAMPGAEELGSPEPAEKVQIMVK